MGCVTSITSICCYKYDMDFLLRFGSLRQLVSTIDPRHATSSSTLNCPPMDDGPEGLMEIVGSEGTREKTTGSHVHRLHGHMLLCATTLCSSSTWARKHVARYFEYSPDYTHWEYVRISLSVWREYMKRALSAPSLLLGPDTRLYFEAGTTQELASQPHIVCEAM